MAYSLLDRMTIRAKLWLLAGSLMGIAIVLWGAGYWIATRMATQSAELVDTIQTVGRATDTTRQAQIEFKTQVQEWKNILVRGHDPAQMDKYRKAFDKTEAGVQGELRKLIDLMTKLELDPAPARKAADEHKKLGEKYREALATWKAGDPIAYRAVDGMLKGIDRPTNEAMDALAASILKEGDRIEEREKGEMAAIVQKGGRFKTVLMLIGLAVAAVVARAILGRIQKSLSEVTEGMERMVAGDLTQGVEVRSSDELGRMARDFNNLLDRFQALFGQLREASSQVASGATELSATAGEVGRTAGEIAAFSEGQRRASENTSAAMTEFAASIQEVAQNIQASGSATEAMVKATDDGAQQGAATVKAMQAIREATQEMVRAVAVIQDIARQTNLLSLNAAIEAAKAGVHGKGFAVVAEEVRKLAERSAEAARQIGNLITQTEEAMREGILTVEATEGAIRTLQANIQGVAAAAREISVATEEQGRTSDEVARQVQESALATERSAAASTELAQTVEEVNRTAEHLSLISETLAATVAQFKVR